MSDLNANGSTAELPPDLDDVATPAADTAADDASWSNEQPTRETKVAAPDNDSTAEDAPDLDGVSDTSETVRDLIDEAIKDASRERDPVTGQFKAKASEADAAAVDDNVAAEEAKKPWHEAQQALADKAFDGWADDHRKAFEAIPAEHHETARKVIAAREDATVTAANEHFAPFLERYEAAKPFMQVLAEDKGISEYLHRVSTETQKPQHEIVRNVLGFENLMRYGTYEQKTKAFADLAKDYGVALDPLVFDGDLPDGGDPRDAKIHDLQQRLSKFEFAERQRATETEAQISSRVASEFQQFASKKNADGSPQYRFAEQVRSAMGELFAKGKANTLAEAYDIAAKPLEDALKAEIKRNADAEVKRRADAVKRAERTRPVRAGSTTRGVTDASLGDLIRDSMRAN